MSRESPYTGSGTRLLDDEVQDFEAAAKGASGAAQPDLGSLFETDQSTASDDLGRANIAVIGVTGVGKSTLINALFRTDWLPTGVGAPVTKSVARIDLPDLPITLYDTPGLELADQSGHLVAEVRELTESLQDGDPAHLLNLAWYCINGSGTRFLGEERETVNGLAEILPVVLVATQVADERDSQFQGLLDSVDPGSLPIVERRAIPILAQPMRLAGTTIEPHGLDDLVDATLAALPEAAKRAFLSSLRSTERVLGRQADEARRVVIAASVACGAVGAIPIPGADAPILASMQALMLMRIGAVFGVSFDRDQLAEMARDLLAAGAMTIAGRYAAGELAKLIPGVGSLASATVAATLTYGLGEAYIYMCRQVVTARAEGRTLPIEDAIKMVLDHMIPIVKTGALPDAVTSRLKRGGTG